MKVSVPVLLFLIVCFVSNLEPDVFIKASLLLLGLIITIIGIIYNAND